jgi:hypothetical protein
MIAMKWQLTREAMEKFALASHQRAQAAIVRRLQRRRGSGLPVDKAEAIAFASRVLRGARHGWRDRLPPEHPDPSLWAGPGKAGLTRGRSQAELGPRRLPRTLLAGAGGAGPDTALGVAPPRPGRVPGGGPADCPRVSRECTGRADPSKRP